MKSEGFISKLAAGASIAGFAISLMLPGCSKSGDESSHSYGSSSGSTEVVGAAQGSNEKVVLRGLQFRPDGSIGPNSKPVLDSAVNVLKGRPNTRVYVNAYCDPKGGRRLNQRLSDERAAVVASYLEEHGVPADHIVPRGFGANHFVTNNTTASGRSQNRRIELVFQTYVPGVTREE